MAAADVFAQISTRQIVALMLHDQLADYFGFLGLAGYRALHEHRYREESAGMRATHRYYLSRYQRLIPAGRPEDPAVLPSGWSGRERSEVDASTRRKAVREGFHRWVEWERGTCQLLAQSVGQLSELGEVAAADEVRRMLRDTDQELADAREMLLELEAVDYDLSVIVPAQEAMAEKYAEK